MAVPLVAVASLAASGTAYAQNAQIDRAALVALYDRTSGDDWASKTNWTSSEPLGEWYGVSTDAASFPFTNKTGKRE